MQSKALFVVVLLALAGISARVGAGGNHQDYINFKGANGSPMSVERVGNGFLLAQAGLFFTVHEVPFIDYIGADGKEWVARWDLGDGMKIMERGSTKGWQSSDSFRFVDWDGKVWQAARVGDEFVLKPQFTIASEVHAACVEVIAGDHSHYLSCCAPNGLQRQVGPPDKVVSYVTEFGFLSWNSSPRMATWKGDHFLIRATGTEPAEAVSLQFLDWDGKRQTASWDGAAKQFVVSSP